MKRALHFPTKLNSRDIQKCNILFLSTLLLSVRLSSQSSISRGDVTATGVHKLRNMWSSLSEVIWTSKSSTVPSKPKFGPPPPLIKNAFVHYFHIDHNTPYLPPSPPPSQKKNCIGIVVKFSWEDCKSQEKLETMLVQNFWGVTKV